MIRKVDIDNRTTFSNAERNNLGWNVDSKAGQRIVHAGSKLLLIS